MGTKLYRLDFVMSDFNAISVDPDQTPGSDLGLTCLQKSHLWDAKRHKLGKLQQSNLNHQMKISDFITENKS